MTEDLDDLMCPHSAAGRPECFPAKACILAGECGCVYGADWSRALRLADDAAESVICTEGHNTEGRQWVRCPSCVRRPSSIRAAWVGSCPDWAGMPVGGCLSVA